MVVFEDSGYLLAKVLLEMYVEGEIVFHLQLSSLVPTREKSCIQELTFDRN